MADGGEAIVHTTNVSFIFLFLAKLHREADENRRAAGNHAIL
jgi:hypothetical protein